MDRWLSTADLAERWHCSLPTARTRMRQMIHMEKPLLVRENVVVAWETARMTGPVGELAPRIKKRRSEWEQPPKDENGRYVIPRRRACQ